MKRKLVRDATKAMSVAMQRPADPLRANSRAGPGRLRVCLVLALLVLLAGAGPKKDSTDSAVRAYDHATWARYQWFAGAETRFSKTHSPYSSGPALLTDSQIESFAQTLLANGVQTVFVFVGSLNAQGNVPLWPVLEGSPYLPASAGAGGQGLPLARLRRALEGRGAQVRLLAWLGGRHAGYERGFVDLGRAEVRARVTRLAQTLVGPPHGFDGLHLNIEPTLNEDKNLLALLEEVRQAMPKDKLLSFAGTMVMPYLARLPKLRERFWTESYLREVARRVDQLAFMTYDTGISSPSLFRWFLGQQAGALVRLTHAANPGCEAFLGVPSYREDSDWHRSEAENVRNAVAALSEAISRLGPEGRAFRGLAVYAAWTTSDEDWALILRHFPARASPPAAPTP